jgi:hypothetical protein
METTKKTKDFDCVEMKNAIQAQIYAEIKDMTNDEILAYFNNPSIKKGINTCHLTRERNQPLPRDTRELLRS